MVSVLGQALGCDVAKLLGSVLPTVEPAAAKPPDEQSLFGKVQSARTRANKAKGAAKKATQELGRIEQDLAGTKTKHQ